MEKSENPNAIYADLLKIRIPFEKGLFESVDGQLVQPDLKMLDPVLAANRPLRRCPEPSLVSCGSIFPLMY